MSQVLTAIYERGALHPVTPLELEEHQRVNIRIVPDAPGENINQVLHWLASIGKITPPRQTAKETPPVSDQQRLKLSRILGKASEKPLSEVILDERGER